MDLRALSILALRLVGVYLIGSTVASFPVLLVSSHPYPAEFWAGALGYIVVGILLISLPGRVTSHALRIESTAAHEQPPFDNLLRFGLILLGFYFVVHGAIWFVYAYAKVRLFYDVVKPFPDSRGPALTPEDFAMLSARALEFALGLALWLGNRALARLTMRIGQ